MRLRYPHRISNAPTLLNSASVNRNGSLRIWPLKLIVERATARDRDSNFKRCSYRNSASANKKRPVPNLPLLPLLKEQPPRTGLDSQTLAGVTGRLHRSEERRVGKECRSRWSPY